MKNIILIALYALIAFVFILLDVIIWIRAPRGFISVSGAVVFGVFGLSAAFLSFRTARKEIRQPT